MAEPHALTIFFRVPANENDTFSIIFRVLTLISRSPRHVTSLHMVEVQRDVVLRLW